MLKRRVRRAALIDRRRARRSVTYPKRARVGPAFPLRAGSAVGNGSTRKLLRLPIGTYLLLALAALAWLAGSLNVASTALTARGQRQTKPPAEARVAALALTVEQPDPRGIRDAAPAAAGFGPHGGSTIHQASDTDVGGLFPTTRSVARVRTAAGGAGTAFVVAPHRLLTADHIVAGVREVDIVLPSGSTDRAWVSSRNSVLDVAVLTAPNLPPHTPMLRLGVIAAPVCSRSTPLGIPTRRCLSWAGTALHRQSPSVSCRRRA